METNAVQGAMNSVQQMFSNTPEWMKTAETMLTTFGLKIVAALLIAVSAEEDLDERLVIERRRDLHAWHDLRVDQALQKSSQFPDGRRTRGGRHHGVSEFAPGNGQACHIVP